MLTDYVGDQRVFLSELRDWWGGTLTGGPNGDGTYPLTNDLGVTTFAPSIALFQNPVVGPAGQAANAAIIAQAAANTATAAVAAMNLDLTALTNAKNAAQDSANAAANSATSTATANTSVWTAKGLTDTARTNAQTANTNANLAKVAAALSEANALSYRNTTLTYQNNAANSVIMATANAVIATTKAGETLASANAAAVSNTNANLAKVSAALSEANALAYRNTTLTYRDNAANSATAASISNATANSSAALATTRAIAAEQAENAAEAAMALAQAAANAAAISAANAAASVGFNIADYQLRSQKGVANGYAGLDANGKVPVAQLDTAVLGGLNFVATWNATTNTPAIPTANATNKGQYYKVGTAGTTTINGVTDWQVGDWLLSNGSIWDKLDNTDLVQSVAGKTGTITLVKGDVGLGSADNTSDASKPVSTAQLAALNLKLNISDKATLTEALVGIEDTHFMTPAKTAAAISNAIAGRIQLSQAYTATGSSQTVDLGVDVQPGELLIFENGVEQNATDFTKNSGTTWTFTRPVGRIVRFVLVGGLRGQSFDGDASGTTAGRSTYDSQPVGFCYLATDTGTFSWRTGAAGTWTTGVTLTGPQGTQGLTGNVGLNGWTPTLSVVADSARYVQKVTDWTGGTGTKPTTNVFVSASGFTANVALATDIRGAQGIQGIQGIQGVAGTNGTNGTNGSNGANGVSATYSLIAPLGLASANAVGVANAAAREDHVHQFPLARISNAVTANAALTLLDHGGVVEWGAATNGTLTLPNSLPQGFNCLVRVTSATGIPTFTAAAGTTIRQADALTKARKQWSEVSVSVRANANGAVAEYVLSGDMS